MVVKGISMNVDRRRGRTDINDDMYMFVMVMVVW